jgi:hypothetical protein
MSTYSLIERWQGFWTLDRPTALDVDCNVDAMMLVESTAAPQFRDQRRVVEDDGGA